MIDQVFAWIESNLDTLVLSITTGGFGLGTLLEGLKKKSANKKLTASEEKNTALQAQLAKISEKLDKVESKMVETVNMSTKTITGDVGIIGESMNKAYANSKSLSDKVKSEISTGLSNMNGLKDKANEIKNVAADAIKKITKPVSVENLKKQAALLQSGVLAKVLSEKEEVKEVVAVKLEKVSDIIEEKTKDSKEKVEYIQLSLDKDFENVVEFVDFKKEETKEGA